MPTAAEVAPLATASNALAFDLWAKTAASGNVAMSPASISLALAMTYGGAKGETAAQMKQVLHLTGDADAAMIGWGTLAGALQAPDRKLKLRIANRLFGEETYTFESPYLERTKAAFGAPLEPTDFIHGADAARDHINGWIADQTEKRIKDLLPPRALTAATRLVLVNAIYFLADWEQPFEKLATSPEPFTLAPGKTSPVPTMHAQAHARLAKVDGVKMLELRYAGGDAAMWIVLPDKPDGLAAVEHGLDPARLGTWKAALTAQPVAIALPKFTIDPADALDLATPLAALGMARAFDAEKADFTGIAVDPDPAKRLYISRVIHKSFVKVDEKGTEAAAATAVVMPTGMGRPEPAEPFVADHPFLFFIVDRASGLVLFMGRVADPAGS